MHFKFLYFGNLFSNTADGFIYLALPLLIYSISNDPLALSAVVAVGILPRMLFSLSIGEFVDRHSRTKILMYGNSLRCIFVSAIVAIVMLERGEHYLLLTFVFILGIIETAVDTSATALTPTLVEKDLDKANSQIQGGQLIAQNFVAVPLAGVLFALAHWVPFMVGGACYGIAAFSGAILNHRLTEGKKEKESRGDPKKIAKGIKSRFEGFKLMRDDEKLKQLLWITLILALAVSMSQSTLIAFLTDFLHTPTEHIGLVSMCLAVGGVAGMLVLPRFLKRFSRNTAIYTGHAGLVICLFLLWTCSTTMQAAVLLCFMSCAVSFWNIPVMTMRQMATPKKILGRVFATVGFLLSIVQIIGSIMGGIVAKMGLNFPFLFAAVIAASALIPVLKLFQLQNTTRDETMSENVRKNKSKADAST